MAALELQNMGAQAVAPSFMPSRSGVDTQRPKKRHQVAKACNHCAVSHLSCSEHRPCDRCVKKGLTCEERPRKKRHHGRHDGSRIGHQDDDDDDVMDVSSNMSPQSARSRKLKRKSLSPDEDYHPDAEDTHQHGPHCSHGHERKIHLQVPGQSVSPTSASPRSARHSDSSDDHNGSDLESLVVAALAEGEEVKSEMTYISHQFDPMSFQSQAQVQANLMGMMPMMPMLPQIPQVPQIPQNPAMNAMNPFAFPMLDPYAMMQFQMLHIQWRFQGQMMPSPLTMPLASTVRDLLVTLYNRMAFDRQLQHNERLSLSLVLKNQRFLVDEQSHAMMPLTMIGLTDPAAILDVSKTI